MLPLVILQGPAKSGKDTVANFLVEDGGFVAIAQADPMKRLAQSVFGFTTEQLWGESRELKEAGDKRFGSPETWEKTRNYLNGTRTDAWCQEVCPNGVDLTWFRLHLQKWFNQLEFDWTKDGKLLSPRVMLQTLGTEFGRSIRQDLWSELAIGTAKKLLKEPGLLYFRDAGLLYRKSPEPVPTPAGVVITDGRFRNEIINVKAAGGMAIRVDNPEQVAPSSVGIAGHASESEQFSIPSHWFDLIVTNNKKEGLEALRQKIQAVIAEFKYVTVIP